MPAAAPEFDETTTNPAALQAMYDELEKGDSPAPAAPEVVVPPVEVKPDPAAAPAPEAKVVAEPEKEPDGIATKDGKHIIPYSVLKADRDRAAAAEQALAAAKAELAALKSAPQGKDVNGEVVATTPAPAADELSEDELAVMKEDFPIQYKIYMANQRQLAAMQSQLKPVQESVQNAEAARQLTVAEQSQEAIDATPKLAHLQASGGAAFERAKQFDNVLKADPDWAGKPLTERFAKVIEMVELTTGPIVIPGQTAAPAPAVKTAEQLKAEAKALAANAAAANNSAVPSSLSDFPAGQPAATDEQAALEGMSILQLAAKMRGMSQDKLEVYLNTI